MGRVTFGQVTLYVFMIVALLMVLFFGFGELILAVYVSAVLVTSHVDDRIKQLLIRDGE